MSPSDTRTERQAPAQDGGRSTAPSQGPGAFLRVAQNASRAAEPPPQDDSGLIDLRALMASAEEARASGRAEPAEATPLPVVRRVPLYPLGSPAELAAARAPAETDAPRPSRAAPGSRWLLGGVAALLGGVALAVLLSRTGVHQVRPVTPPAAVVEARAATVAAASEAQGVPRTLPAATTAQAPAEVVATAAPVASPSATPATAAPPPRRPAVQKPKLAEKKATAGPERVSAPPVDACNGNLLCEMKRATQDR